GGYRGLGAVGIPGTEFLELRLGVFQLALVGLYLGIDKGERTQALFPLFAGGLLDERINNTVQNLKGLIGILGSVNHPKMSLAFGEYFEPGTQLAYDPGALGIG